VFPPANTISPQRVLLKSMSTFSKLWATSSTTAELLNVYMGNPVRLSWVWIRFHRFPFNGWSTKWFVHPAIRTFILADPTSQQHPKKPNKTFLWFPSLFRITQLNPNELQFFSERSSNVQSRFDPQN
jgi:hypothetical protein